jgi:outer membrane receptor for ferrienterochelin and colicin
LAEENLRVQTSASQPLQDHSKHIINASLNYDNIDTGTQATLLYNVATEHMHIPAKLNTDSGPM